MNFGSMSPTQRYALVVGAVVIVVIAFLIVNGTFEIGGGGGDGDNDSLALDQRTAPAGDAAADDAPDAGAGMGGAVAGPTGLPAMDQAFQFGDLRMAVTEIRLGDRVGAENDEVEALERFATVQLSARNTGRTAFDLVGRLLLVDGQERGFAPNAAATGAAARAATDRGDALTVALQPGITTDLVVVFDIAEEAEDFRLRVRGGFVEVALDR